MVRSLRNDINEFRLSANPYCRDLPFRCQRIVDKFVSRQSYSSLFHEDYLFVVFLVLSSSRSIIPFCAIPQHREDVLLPYIFMALPVCLASFGFTAIFPA